MKSGPTIHVFSEVFGMLSHCKNEERSQAVVKPLDQGFKVFL